MLELPDSWVWDFWHAQDDDGTHHLFFLYASRALGDPNLRHRRAAVGHAVSTDLRTWRRVADALVHGSPPAFDQTATWTGSVVRGDDARWHLFYTGTTLTDEGQLVQQVGHATSADLHGWTKREDPVARADARWYEKVGGPAGWIDEHWRDPWVMRDPDGEGWHMLVTARSREGDVAERGVVGHATSPDLFTWTVQPPLTEPRHGFGQLEVFQSAAVEGRDVLVFNCLAGELSPERRERFGHGGIWAAPAASAVGPYDLDAAYLLTDESLYVGKIVDSAEGAVLLAFVNEGPDGAFGGCITDPMPLRWEGERLVVQR